MKAPRAIIGSVLATIALVFLFIGVRLVMHPLLGDNAQLMLFILPVILAALIGDFYIGVFAAFLSSLAGIYFFIKPYYSFQIESNADFFHIVTFVVIGTVISWLVEQLHYARAVAERKAAEARQEAVESRIAEEYSRESEERFRNVANAAPVMIWTTDAEKKCTWVNKYWLEFTGRKMEEETGDCWTDKLHPDDTNDSVQVFTAAFDARKPFSVEFRMLRHDNEYLWLLNNGVPRFTPSGEFLGYIGSIIGIDERKRAESENSRLLEEARSARAQAEVESRLKDEFIGTVSHELRTPLNAILGWTQMVRSGMIGADQYDRAIEVIERNARSQAQLIEDLLDVTRITSGKFRLNVRPVDLQQVIEAAIDTVRPAAEAKEIEIQASLEARTGVILGDADRLQQVVWNLLSNAVKFSDKNSQIEVRLEKVDSSAEIVVRDKGKGIETEFLPYVFDRFRQQDGATTRKYGGLGLGLAIVRHIVELHGGTVRAESEGEGTGATFIVCLPLRAVAENKKVFGVKDYKSLPATALNDVPELSIDLQGLKILVVDDEPDARELLTSLLTVYGADVTTCSSAAEVLSVLPTIKPHVLVSDIGMPNMDGYALIKQVREMESQLEKSLPAIALTAYTRVEDRVRALAQGFQMFVPKPIEPSELLQAIKSLAGLSENLKQKNGGERNGNAHPNSN